MNGKIAMEIQNEIIKCIGYGMKDPNSIYQKVIDTVPLALADTETEILVNNMVEILK